MLHCEPSTASMPHKFLSSFSFLYKMRPVPRSGISYDEHVTQTALIDRRSVTRSRYIALLEGVVDRNSEISRTCLDFQGHSMASVSVSSQFWLAGSNADTEAMKMITKARTTRHGTRRRTIRVGWKGKASQWT